MDLVPRSKRRFTGNAVSLGLSLATGLLAILLSSSIRRSEIANVRRSVDGWTETVRQLLATRIEVRLEAVENVHRIMEARPGLDRSDWEMTTTLLVRNLPGVRAIEWADTANRIRWVAPTAGNENIEGLDLGREPRRRIAIGEARRQNRLIVTPPIDLFQGGRGFLAYRPLFIDNEFRGTVVGVFQAEELFKALLPRADAGDVSIDIVDAAGGKLYSSGTIDTDFQRAFSLQLGSIDWRVIVGPTERMVEGSIDHSSTYVLIGGLLVSLLIGGLSLATANARLRSEELAREVAERSVAEQRLRESQDRFDAFMENLPLITVLKAEDGTILHVNSAYERAFDLDIEKIRGKSDADLWPKEEADQIRKHDLEVLRLGRHAAFDMTTNTANGVRHWRAFKFAFKNQVGRSFVATTALDVTDQVNARRELDESRARLAHVERMGRIGFWYRDLREPHTVWSDGHYALVGRAPGSFVPTFDAFFECVHPDDRDRIREHAREATLLGQTSVNGYRVVWPDGQVREIESTLEAIQDRDGNVTAIFGTAMDVTERREATRQIEEREQELTAIIEAALDSVIVLDGSGTIREFNPAAERTFGFARAEMIGRRVEDTIIPERLRARHATGFERYLNGGAAVHLGIRIQTTGVRANGSEFPIDLAVTETRVRGDRAFAAYVRDITDQKAAQDRLAESESRFRQMAESIDQVFWLADANPHQMLYVSPAFEKLWGFPGSELYRGLDRWVQAIHPDDRQRIIEASRDFNSGVSTSYEVDYRIVLPDGTIRWILDIGAQIRDETGAVRRVSGVAKDISEFYRNEAAREILEKQLRQAQKMEAIGTLAGGIAHDFNNLLGVIVGSLELARLKIRDEEAVARHLESISKASNRATELIRQILMFSRKAEQNARPIKLVDVAAEAVALIRTNIPPAVNIETVFSSPDAAVVADPGEVFQTVMNLCTNASQALPATGGSIQLSIDVVAVDGNSKEPADLKPGHYARLAVTDNGSGMDRATVDRIFEPFFTTKQPGKGSGLGMAVVHGIVRGMGGAVLIDSEVGRGTTVSVYIPTTTAPVSVERFQAPRVKAGRGERILFVDDEVLLTETSADMLRQLGYVVTVAVSAAEAYIAFARNPEAFDLVITDLAMPGRSGIDLAQDLLRFRPTLPIILVSGYLGTTDPEAIARVGFRAVVSKPLSFDRLGEIVATTCLQREGARVKADSHPAGR